ncbi:RNA polymerase sigma-70 factor, ECF subfamily [Parapedobacter composti]|uniref:RNA polymerase sigma-70 factor, ECF subfamily n=1 Tax=Parapedobacter composti TaxID=623281 RepID=A0A1I1DTZ5_9SPHI|nr:RNA polymerase sigma-70 factor [Parapedobacter composti]SFB77892.1 RNA polymerase sigma-70 factor, ECF subfamily [Parapedobacter composti]
MAEDNQVNVNTRVHYPRDSDEINAFREMYLNYYKRLFVRAFMVLKNREVAEDVVQDLFLKLWQSKGYDKALQLDAYLYRAVQNACFDYIKRNKQLESVFFESFIDDMAEAQHLLAQEDVDDKLKQLRNALDGLPEQCKKIFDLVYLQQKKYQEAADITGVSINTVKTQLKRGLIKIREYMQQFRC